MLHVIVETEHAKEIVRLTDILAGAFISVYSSFVGNGRTTTARKATNDHKRLVTADAILKQHQQQQKQQLWQQLQEQRQLNHAGVLNQHPAIDD